MEAWSHKEATGGRTAGSTMAPPKKETRKQGNSRGVAISKG